ncbi:MAG TPA: YafY family protein [Burkholderiaceae bacterium]|nr:YafY family protein [Burkholderiaceae bacterium]
MSRSERLLNLLQLLRRHRHPVSGTDMADELQVSLRTLYRDIATLRAQGASIDGAPGLGYVLRAGFVLPPLMFTAEEIEALVLGSRWVGGRGDSRLAAAARDALAKIAAVLPPELRHELDTTALLVAPAEPPATGDAEVATLRRAIRQEHKLVITYRDADGADTSRTIWPFALGYFDRCRVLVAWCELRQAVRHFRTDRIVAVAADGTRYPRRRHALEQEWRQQQGLPKPS